MPTASSLGIEKGRESERELVATDMVNKDIMSTSRVITMSLCTGGGARNLYKYYNKSYVQSTVDKPRDSKLLASLPVTVGQG